METKENKPKKPLYKRLWFWPVALFGLLMIMSIFVPKDPNGKTGAPEKKLTPTQEAIVDAVPSGCSWGYDTAKHEAEMYWAPNDFWDYKALVHDHFTKGIDFARKVFPNAKEVQSVALYTSLEFTDANGKKERHLALSHVFLRGPFMQVQWDNLKDRPIFRTLLNCVDTKQSYVHPNTQAQIDWGWVAGSMMYD